MYCGKAVGTYNGGAIDADARRQRLLDAKQCAASTDAVDTGCNATFADRDYRILAKCPDTHVTTGVEYNEVGCHWRKCKLATMLPQNTQVYCGYKYDDYPAESGGCGTLNGIQPPDVSLLWDRPLTISGLPLPFPKTLTADDLDSMLYECPTGMQDAGFEDVQLFTGQTHKFRKCVFAE
jgi:hypothetical protein